MSAKITKYAPLKVAPQRTREKDISIFAPTKIKFYLQIPHTHMHLILPYFSFLSPSSSTPTSTPTTTPCH